MLAIQFHQSCPELKCYAYYRDYFLRVLPMCAMLNFNNLF